MSDIKIGKYQHYKGGLYEVIGVAHHSETLEELVVYKMLYNKGDYKIGDLWVRPKKMFLETIVVDSVETPRFKYIG